MLTFNRNSLLLTTTSPRRPVHYRNGVIISNVTWIQRRSALAEIEFLTLFWDPILVPAPIILYVGHASCIHDGLMSKLFPDASFHLFTTGETLNSNEVGVAPSQNPKITTFSEVFTEAVARRYSGRSDIYLIVDNAAFSGATTPAATLVQTELNTITAWVNIIQPVDALLSFRLPPAKGNGNAPLRTLQGQLLWSVWGPPDDDHTYLRPIKSQTGVTGSSYLEGEWSLLDYEQWLFFHNTISRQRDSYFNPFTGNSGPTDPPELDESFDSAAEAFIFKLYLQKIGVTDTTTGVRLSRLLTSELNRCLSSATSLNLLRNRGTSNETVALPVPLAILSPRPQVFGFQGSEVAPLVVNNSAIRLALAQDKLVQPPETSKLLFQLAAPQVTTSSIPALIAPSVSQAVPTIVPPTLQMSRPIITPPTTTLAVTRPTIGGPISNPMIPVAAPALTPPQLATVVAPTGANLIPPVTYQPKIVTPTLQVNHPTITSPIISPALQLGRPIIPPPITLPGLQISRPVIAPPITSSIIQVSRPGS